MHLKNEQLPARLIEEILEKLGFSKRPSLDLSGLSRLYESWCRKIPFDNIRKRIHLAEGNTLPLPGHDDVDFFQGWLRFGVGGTCWAGNSALYTLLDSLGFSCTRTTATMMTTKKQPINHGTVAVCCEEKTYLVDASMLYNRPLLLSRHQSTAIDHPAWGLTCSPLPPHWLIKWRPLHMLQGCNCRIEEFSVTRDTFRKFNEISRTRGPFNASLYIRINTPDRVIGIANGSAFAFLSSGEVRQKVLTYEERLATAIEKIGISEEIIAKTPADLSRSSSPPAA